MPDNGLQLFGVLPLTALVFLLPLLGATTNLVLGRWLSRRAVHTIAVGAVAAAFGVCVYLVFWPLLHQYRTGVPVPEIKQHVYTWFSIGADPQTHVGGLTVDLAMRLDTLSAVMVLVVTGVGTLIHIYSTGYMADEPRYAAYFGYLNLFTGAMLILVLGASLPIMFIGWEGVGLCSYLLIGFWFENNDYASAGRKAFVVNRIGDAAFLLGMFLLWYVTKDLGFHQSLDFGDLRGDTAMNAFAQKDTFFGTDRWATIIGILLFIGACGKSAQIPLYVWLPDAMAGPTPVSALIHAATMVTAGVYMVCRMSFLYASSTTAMLVVATVGTLTAVVAAFYAFAQTDLKKVLAYSTVSQLGFMFAAAGTGNWVAAIFHLGTHAFFKAGLFLGAGSVMHGMNGSGDITRMGGLKRHMKYTRWTFLIYCLAIAGFPLTSGFFSKDDILGGAWSAGLFGHHPAGWPSWYGTFLWLTLILAALGTAVYMWRLYFLVFEGDERSDDAHHAHESPASMTGPLVILAALAAFAGAIGLPSSGPTVTDEIKQDAAAPAIQVKEPKGAILTVGEGDNKTTATVTDKGPAVVPISPQDADADLDVEVRTPDGEVSKQWLDVHSHQADAHGPTTYDVDTIRLSEPPVKLKNWLARWLAPSVDDETENPLSFGAMAMLMVIATLIGLGGIGIAWWLYGRGPSKKVEQWTAEGHVLHEPYIASKNKLWVDEAYDLVIVRPFRGLARLLFELVDRFVIDTVLVGGWAFVVGILSRVSRWVQNGQVQRYIVGVVLGATAIFFFSRCEHRPEVDYQLTPATVQLKADPGKGLASVGLAYQWDYTGDGVADTPLSTDPALEKPRGEVASTVTLWMQPMNAGKPDGKPTIVTQVIHVWDWPMPRTFAAQGGK